MNTKILLSISTLALCATTVEVDAQTKKPNVLLLLADDLGYAELGCYGQQIIETPNLDRLAQNGVRFTDFHSGNAVSSPSRAVLMTGIPSGYNTIRGNQGRGLPNGATRVPLKKSDVTLAEMLKGAGYQTAFVGKWHLGSPDDLSTWAFARGFDFASQEQWSDKTSTRIFTEGMEYINGVQDSIYYDNTKWDCKDEFRTQIAFDYLDSQLDTQKPFFLFMSYRAPHAHEWYINNKELYADRGWSETERMHAAKITLLDRQVGRMLDKLEEMGELENTIVIFTSDNGPQNEGHDYDFFKSNGEYRGYKRDTFEGGHRVPCIVSWKGHIEDGFVSDYLCGGQDIVPTVVEAVGLEPLEQVQGVSLLPVIAKSGEPKRDAMYWELYDSAFSRQAVRMGDWKAVRYGLSAPIRLYNLANDPGETKDLSSVMPDVMARMTPRFESMRTQSKYFGRREEDSRARFLKPKNERSFVLGDKSKLSIREIDDSSVLVREDYQIVSSNAPIKEPYLIRTMLFEDTGVELIRLSEMQEIDPQSKNFKYRQEVRLQNPNPEAQYYVRSEVVRSKFENGAYKEKIVDVVVKPFKVK